MKLTDFLKKHSLIDDDFIDDFYSFYDENHNEFDFVINLNILAKWLMIRKDNAKKILNNHFIN
jgi:hypothetical protein